MHTTFGWDNRTPEEVAEAFEQLPQTLADRLEAALQDIGVRIASSARGNAPVDRGRLRSSLTSVVQQVGQTLVQLEVGTNVDQAEPIERGTDPFFPPPSELRGWARRVLGDESAAWPVAKSISESGISEQPYLAPAFEENLTWALDRILQGVREAFEEVGLA